MSGIYKVNDECYKEEEDAYDPNHRINSQLLYFAGENERQPKHRSNQYNELLARKERIK